MSFGEHRALKHTGRLRNQVKESPSIFFHQRTPIHDPLDSRLASSRFLEASAVEASFSRVQFRGDRGEWQVIGEGGEHQKPALRVEVLQERPEELQTLDRSNSDFGLGSERAFGDVRGLSGRDGALVSWGGNSRSTKPKKEKF